jgi:hypothetical protein
MSKREQQIRAALAAIGYDAKRLDFYPRGFPTEAFDRPIGWFADCQWLGYNAADALKYIAAHPDRFTKDEL